jgi:hypothetical protein
MAAITVSSLSREYVRVPVFAKVNGVSVKLTTATIEMAFKDNNTAPLEADWQNGVWEYDKGAGTYYAQCLVGPGGEIALPAGFYEVWIRINLDPELVVRKVGTLIVE